MQVVNYTDHRHLEWRATARVGNPDRRRRHRARRTHDVIEVEGIPLQLIWITENVMHFPWDLILRFERSGAAKQRLQIRETEQARSNGRCDEVLNADWGRSLNPQC